MTSCREENRRKLYFLLTLTFLCYIIETMMIRLYCCLSHYVNQTMLLLCIGNHILWIIHSSLGSLWPFSSLSSSFDWSWSFVSNFSSWSFIFLWKAHLDQRGFTMHLTLFHTANFYFCILPNKILEEYFPIFVLVYLVKLCLPIQFLITPDPLTNLIDILFFEKTFLLYSFLWIYIIIMEKL